MFKVFIFLVIISAITSNLVNSVKVNLNTATCDVKDCTNCGPSTSKSTEKKLVCYGPEEFSIDGETSNKNYTILLSSATESKDHISRLVMIRMNVIKQFQPNITTKMKSILIERSIVKELNTNLLKGISHLSILDSKVEELKLSNLQDLNSIYLRSIQLNTIDLDGLVNLKQLVLKELTLKEMDPIEKLHTGLDILVLDTVNILINNKPYFNALSNLNKLVITKTKFLNNTIGDKVMNGLYGLKYLDLSKNEIEALDEFAFSEISNLEVLILSYNNLKQVDWTLFNKLKKLTELNMRNNIIDSVIVSTTKNLTEVRKIDLSFNQITVIEELTFRDHYMLNELELKANFIGRFHKRAFDNLKSLTYLNMDRQLNGEIRQQRFYRFDSCKTIENKV